MIIPKYNKVVIRFFYWYIPFIIRRDFESVTIHSELKSFPNAILILSNHFSWWDAFFMVYLNIRLFKKRYHVMMLEEQLNKFRIFSYGGVYSVKKKSRDMIESLDFTCHLLENKKNLVQLFPQGDIQSQHVKHITFRKGISYVIDKAAAGYQLLFSVALVDYFSTRKPHLHLFVEEAVGLQKHSLENSFNEFYTRCKLSLIAEHD